MQFNEELLIEILGWQSESRKEQEQIIPQLKTYLNTLYLNALNIDNSLLIEEDTHGNIYVTKGRTDLYPCVVSHLDQVHRYNPNKTIIRNGDYLLAFDGAEQIGTGGDDLTGVFMCLNLLDECDNIKVVFFVSEEIGCIGSNACDLDFFKDCKFIGQADRKGNADFINYSNGVQLFDEEFSTFVKPILEIYKYKECTGVATDAGALSKRNVGIACFNISCGYYNPHTSREYVCVSEVKTCFNIFCEIILNADKQFKYIRVEKHVSYPKTSSKTHPLYTQLYNRFKKHPKYVKSQKLTHAYGLAIGFFLDLIDDYDRMIDTTQPDYPYMSDMISEYLDYLDTNEELEKEDANHNNSLAKQISLFDKNCQHKNVKYDNTMSQYYCMDCFNYVDEKSTFYDQETLNPNNYYDNRGYY